MQQTSMPTQHELEKSAVQIKLLKGPIYRNKNRDLWLFLEREQYQVREYFNQIGLSLRMDEAEGYAFLVQQDFDQEDCVIEMPRLIARRSMTFATTLLLVLLRKRLAEHDSEDSSPRLLVTKDEMHQWLQPFFAAVNNEVKQVSDFNGLIKKVMDMGFLTVLPHHKDEYEVQRIIKAMVDAEQIAQLLEKLKQYSEQEVA